MLRTALGLPSDEVRCSSPQLGAITWCAILAAGIVRDAARSEAVALYSRLSIAGTARLCINSLAVPIRSAAWSQRNPLGIPRA